jgi:uncharacterized protein YbcI
MSISTSGMLGDGSLTVAISDAMVGVLARHTGRGATSAWTTIGPDLIVCVMADALTKGEKSLVRHGNGQAVLDIRRAYQDSMAEEAIRTVEELSGRRVAAFLSNNHIDPDLGVETFVLYPSADGDEAEEPSANGARLN